MSKKKKQNLTFKQTKKDQTKVTSLGDLKGAMAETNTTESDNMAAAKAAAPAESVETINSSTGEVTKAVAKEDNGDFKGKFANDPENTPFPAKGKKGRPLPSKAAAKASAEIVKAVDLSTPEARHEVAEEIKAGVVAKADGLFDEPAEETPEEVITPPAGTDAQSETTGDEANKPDGEDTPPSNEPSTMVVDGGNISEDAVTPDAALIVEGEEVTAAAKEDPQEEPTGQTVENGEAEISDTAEITDKAEISAESTIIDGVVINEETAVSDLVGTSESPSLDLDTEITPATDENEDAVIAPEPEVNAAAKADEPEVINEAPEVSTSSEDVAAEEIQLGFSNDHLRKLENAWLKKNSEIYKIKPREEIKQMIIDEYATKPTESIKGGQVLSRIKELSVKIYDDAHPKNAEKAAAKAMRHNNAAAKSDNATVIESTPLSTDAPAVKANADSSDATITSDAAGEKPAEALSNGEEVATEIAENVAAKADEAVMVDNPQPLEETVSIKLEEPVDTSEPVAMAKEDVAPEALNTEITETNATGETSDESVNKVEEVPFDVDEQSAAAKVDTAGTVGNSEVAATDTVNQQAEEVKAGEVSNDASAKTDEANKTDAEATVGGEVNAAPGIAPENVITEDTAETDATVNQENPDRGITEPATNTMQMDIAAAQAITNSAPVNGSPVIEKHPDTPSLKGKKGKQKFTHVGGINHFMQIAGPAVKSAYTMKNGSQTAIYKTSNGQKFAQEWMRNNKFDFDNGPVNYFDAAEAFCQAHNYLLIEHTGLKMANGRPFNKSALVRILKSQLPALGDWSIFKSLITAIEHSNEHTALERDFICIAEPVTSEADKLRSQLAEVTIALAKAEQELKDAVANHAQELITAKARDEELTVIAGNALDKARALDEEVEILTDELLTNRDAVYGVVEANNPPQANEEADTITDPKVMKSLQKLVAKVVKSIRWQFSQRQEIRTLRKLLAAEMKTWKLELVEEQRLASQTEKAEKNLKLHRQLFLHQKSLAFPRVVTVFKGQAEPGTVKWDYENQKLHYQERMVEIRPLTFDERQRLEAFRNSPNLAGKSPMQRLNERYPEFQTQVNNGHQEEKHATVEYLTIANRVMFIDNRGETIDGYEDRWVTESFYLGGEYKLGVDKIVTNQPTGARWIENPKPAVIRLPDTLGAPVLFDARYSNKEKPSENSDADVNQPTNEVTEEPKSATLVSKVKFPVVPISIIQRLDYFDRAVRNEYDHDYHIVLVNDSGVHTQEFENTVTPWIEELSKEGSIEYTARDYIDHIRGLARTVGYPRHQTLDMFSMFSMSMNKAQGLLADLRGIDVSAVLLQYPQRTNDLISVAEIWPKHIAMNIGHARYKLDENSEQYMKFTAAADMLSLSSKSVEWFLVRKSVELLTLDNKRIIGPAAYVNFYNVAELTTPQVLAFMVKNAPAQAGIPYVTNVEDAIEVARKHKIVPPIVVPTVSTQLAS